MNAYLCLKPLTLFGVNYLPGECIPAEAILRAGDLLQMGCIAPLETPEAWETATGARSTLDAPEVFFNIPIGGENIPANERTVALTASLMQMTVEQAGEAVKEVTDQTALVLIQALESRKGVKNAAAARLETLRDGDA